MLQPTGTSLDKIVSDYQAIYGQMDEDTILRKCKNAINRLEKADKEVGGEFNSGTSHTCSWEFLQLLACVVFYICVCVFFIQSCVLDGQ